MHRFSILVALLLSASQAFALGHDQPKEEIARRPHCVHGYFVNWEDVFFYAGDTAALNEFLAAYGKMKGSTLKVVLHVGPQRARSPWDKEDRGEIDWTYYVWNGRDETVDPVAKVPPGKLAPSRVDIWLGRRIKLAELKIPENIEVESGGEIEKFIQDREKQPADASPKAESKSPPKPADAAPEGKANDKK